MIIKFRTMHIDAPGDVPTHLLENAHRNITRCGKFLRKTSLDELPQLINVLRGDMSIVGPRPALWNQFDLIAMRDRTGANDVLPGIAGLAQVQGRDRLENEDKAKYDGIYARNISFRLDMKVHSQGGDQYRQRGGHCGRHTACPPQGGGKQVKRVLIAGADSYIGTRLAAWLDPARFPVRYAGYARR